MKIGATQSRWSLFLLGFLTLASAGCLDFEKQTMLVVFPKDGKEIRALLVYHGLHVSKVATTGEASDLEKAKDDLVQLVGGETFYLGDSLLRIYLKPGKDDKPRPWDIKAMKVLNKHLAPGKGIFVMGKESHYSYCQPLAVRDPAPFVAWLNQIIGEEIIDMARQDPKEGKKAPPIFVDEKTMKMMEQAAKKGFPFLRVEPGRISFKAPGSSKFFAELKRDVVGGNLSRIKKDLEALLDPASKSKVDPAKLRQEFARWESDLNLLAETPWSLDQRPNQLTLGLGWGDGLPFRLALESNRQRTLNPHNKDLLAFARTLGVPFRDNVSIDKVLERFERDQVLAVPEK